MEMKKKAMARVMPRVPMLGIVEGWFGWVFGFSPKKGQMIDLPDDTTACS